MPIVKWLMKVINNNYKKIGFLVLVMIASVFVNACDQENQKSYQGYIEGDLNYLASPYSGVLQTLYVNKGDRVKQGDPVYQLDPQPQQAQQQQALGNLQQAESQLADLEKGQRETVLASLRAQIKQAEAEQELARKNLIRYRQLYLQKAIEELQYDQAKRNAEQSQNRVKELNANLAEAVQSSRIDLIKAQKDKIKSLQATVEELTWQLRQKTKAAPDAGRIFDRFYLPGEFIAENKPVVSLLITKNIKLVFYIPETTLSQIKIGQGINFSCDGCKQLSPATINFISPNAEFTPPVIFSRERREKLVYRVEAKLTVEVANSLNAGQPVDVYLNSSR